MQVPDAGKREKILAAAARLFSLRPFHKVLLTDVAAAAGVGKGTLYLYFRDKDDLYAAVVHDRFAENVVALEKRLRDGGEEPEEQLRIVVESLVRLSHDNPELFRLIRESNACPVDPKRGSELRQRLVDQVEAVLRRGVEQGVFVDPRPDLSARMITGLSRSVYVYGEAPGDPDEVCAHILHMVLAAITPPANA